jgi:SAM-dependent methyltransferase
VSNFSVKILEGYGPASANVGMSRAQVEATVSGLSRDLPVSLVVRECMRLLALLKLNCLVEPILDIGCGDGLFWETLMKVDHDGAIRSGKIVGVDIQSREVGLARSRAALAAASFLEHDIASPPGVWLRAQHSTFSCILCNCSIEHIERLDQALRNIHSLLRPGGQFVLIVPAADWTKTMALRRILEKVSPRLAMSYAGLIDGFFQHHHLYKAEIWELILKRHGFKCIDTRGIGGEEGNRLFEAGLPSAMLGFVSKVLFGRYSNLSKTIRRLFLRHQRPWLNELISGDFIKSDASAPEVVEYLISGRK